jgi:hypothetical protein
MGSPGLSAEHVAELGGLVHDLVEADADEVHEHDLDHGAQPRQRRPRGGAHEGAFRDGRVEHAVRPELVQEPLGDAKGAAPGVLLGIATLAAGDVLAEDHHAGVGGHLLMERLVERGAERLLGHHRRPSYST